MACPIRPAPMTAICSDRAIEYLLYKAYSIFVPFLQALTAHWGISLSWLVCGSNMLIAMGRQERWNPQHMVAIRMILRGLTRDRRPLSIARTPDAELFRAKPQGARLEAQAPGSPVWSLNNPPGLFKHLEDMAPLYLLEGLTRVR